MPPRVRRPGDGEASWRAGDLFVVRATGDDTGGAYSLTEMTVAPRASGPHVHHHPDIEEAFYVVEGEIRLQVDGEEVAAPAGTFAVVPRGARPAYTNPRDEPARVLVIISPPGFEACFRDMGKPAPRRELPPR